MKHFYLTATFSTALALNVAIHADGAQKPASATPFIEHHNRIAVFNIEHLTYERIKTDSLYAGVESWFLPVATKHHHHHHSQYLFEGEFRMGYNFFWNGRDHFTPLAGAGYLQQFHRTDGKIRHDKPGAVSENRFEWGNPVAGIDISLPITFRFGYQRRWDIRLEPFDIYLHGSKNSCNYFGGRSTVGFRF